MLRTFLATEWKSADPADFLSGTFCLLRVLLAEWGFVQWPHNEIGDVDLHLGFRLGVVEFIGAVLCGGDDGLFAGELMPSHAIQQRT